MASPGKKVFIIGPGFIGWNVLDLLVKENYDVTAFVRREEHAKELKSSGASQAVLGDIGDKALITKHVINHDIVIHTATADHLESVEAVLDGVQQRADKGLNTIFIHTSGTGVLGDGTPGKGVTSKVYHDNVKAEVDSVSDDAVHRQIDLHILAAQKRLKEKAKMAIVLPPLIYGFNPRHGRLSIQIPVLTRYAIKHGFAGHMGDGDPVWSTIHVLDLARAYITVLHHLESQAFGSADLDNPYWFTENTGDEEVSWREVAEAIGQGLHAAGLIDSPTPRTIPPETYGDLFGDISAIGLGLNSRSRAVRLRELGWKPVEKSWKESFLEDELPVLLKERSG